MRVSVAATWLAALAGVAQAHPGHNVHEEALERRAYLQTIKRSSLDHCAAKLKARGVEAKNVARRAAALEHARVTRAVARRDVDESLGKSHNVTDQGFTPNTPYSELFTGNASCILTPEVTAGPYYVGGESIRKDITDGQEAVELLLDYQVIDVNTCDPVPNVYVEIWHCNATGVYSGVVARGNGDSSVTSNLNETFYRGIQPTDSDGVAQFVSGFPGHYTGRAPHIHIMVHTNATLYANETLGNKVYASHVGQSFFDQTLISEVEALDPYNTNTQVLTTNVDDGILSEEAATTDPLQQYVYIGDSVDEGIFAWLAFGINTTYSGEVSPASFYYKEGGVANPNSGGGGPGGPGGPPGANTSTTTAS